jgi:hypothetical protein
MASSQKRAVLNARANLVEIGARFEPDQKMTGSVGGNAGVALGMIEGAEHVGWL